jgi:LacI family transcriptional regulator
VLLEKRIDGLIVGSAGAPQTLARRLRVSPVPLVVIDRVLPGLAADLVQIDHEEGGYLATKYLIDLGHKTIGCITGPSNTTASSDRLAGYRRALAEATLPYRQRWVAQSDFSSEGGYQAAARLLQRPGLTAVFASNDLMGIGLLRYAAEKGVRVPQELSVIGFDGIELGRYVHPALTTIGQSIRQLGELAANTLIQCIGRRGKGPYRQLVLPPEIIVRESSAPPNSLRNRGGRRAASR